VPTILLGMGAAISVRGLRVVYRARNGKSVLAVDGLTFDVQQGEVVGFLGPNGAGKSSTLKALMGFTPIAAGQAEMLGEAAGSEAARMRTGYLPEVAMYYPFLTPLETLTLYGELQGLRGKPLRTQALELLDLLGVASAARKQNRTLSKGMLQRVGIAQALLGRPELLIMDEVTSGLDPIGRHELRSLLKERQRQGTTLFFSSHELSEVEMLCDRTLLIDKGRLIEERRVEALKTELRQYRLTYRGKEPSNAMDWHNAASDLITASFRTKDDLLRAIASADEVLDVVAQEGSLEEYFIDTLRRAA
jgi:ABC-2 type transport system ATP-binding protein